MDEKDKYTEQQLETANNFVFPDYSQFEIRVLSEWGVKVEPDMHGDGIVVNFPDGMSDEDLGKAIKKIMNLPPPSPLFIRYDTQDTELTTSLSDTAEKLKELAESGKLLLGMKGLTKPSEIEGVGESTRLLDKGVFYPKLLSIDVVNPGKEAAELHILKNRYKEDK